MGLFPLLKCVTSGVDYLEFSLLQLKSWVMEPKRHGATKVRVVAPWEEFEARGKEFTYPARKSDRIVLFLRSLPRFRRVHPLTAGSGP